MCPHANTDVGPDVVFFYGGIESSVENRSYFVNIISFLIGLSGFLFSNPMAAVSPQVAGKQFPPSKASKTQLSMGGNVYRAPLAVCQYTNI